MLCLFLNTYTALLVVSSSNEDPVAAFTELYQQQKKMESLSYPKWMTPHVYCWHVLLHDVVAGNARRSVIPHWLLTCIATSHLLLKIIFMCVHIYMLCANAIIIQPISNLYVSIEPLKFSM